MSFGIVYGTFWFFDSQESAANAAAQRFPLAAGYQRPAPTPSLQTQPFRDIYLLRDEEAKKLRLATAGSTRKAASCASRSIARWN